MRVKRLKTVRRHLDFYRHSFKFHAPLQVLVDGTFCQVALQTRIHIKEQLPKVLGMQTKELVTRCIVEEIRKLGPDFGGALVIARRFESRRCGHDTPIPAADCLRSMVGETNPHSYLVATQDTKLRNDLRRIPAVPLCYIQYNTVILEEPSAASTQRAKELEAAKAMPKPSEIAAAKKVKEEGKPAFVLHRKQPAKGPNPLSVKKSTAAKAAPKTPEKKAVKSAEEKPQTSDNAEAESSEAATKKRAAPEAEQTSQSDAPEKKRRRRRRRKSAANSAGGDAESAADDDDE